MFIFLTFIISYTIFYLLILINFIKIYSFATYIPLIVILLGLLSLLIFIDTTYYNKFFITNDITNNIKINVSISLIFVILGLSLIILSINLLNSNYGLYNLIKILSNTTIQSYTIFSLLYIIINILIFFTLLFLLTFINRKFLKYEDNILINNFIFILVGTIFVFFS